MKDEAALREALQEARQVLVTACGTKAPYIRVALEHIDSALLSPPAPADPRQDYEPRDEDECDYGARMYQLGRRHMREESTPAPAKNKISTWGMSEGLTVLPKEPAPAASCKGEGAWLPGMIHALDCRCERCKESRVNGWFVPAPAGEGEVNWKALWTDPLEQLWYDYEEFECSCSGPEHACYFHANFEQRLSSAHASGYTGILAKFVAARSVAYSEGFEDGEPNHPAKGRSSR